LSIPQASAPRPVFHGKEKLRGLAQDVATAGDTCAEVMFRTVACREVRSVAIQQDDGKTSPQAQVIEGADQ